ncbi:MAG TPA: VOC family protein [Acidobacteriaceae bacterium]|nr:VOC family protein [Acidobacteriaceae bacterium]
MKLLTQLNFPGNCAQAFQYYEQNLGGKIIMLMRQSQAPGAPQNPAGPDPVIHARLDLGGTVLLGNDVPPDRHQPMRSTYLYLALDSAEEAERVYGLLKEGGQVFMPLEETFFASRFSQLRDQFGTLWSLIHERAK